MNTVTFSRECALPDNNNRSYTQNNINETWLKGSNKWNHIRMRMSVCLSIYFLLFMMLRKYSLIELLIIALLWNYVSIDTQFINIIFDDVWIIICFFNNEINFLWSFLLCINFCRSTNRQKIKLMSSHTAGNSIRKSFHLYFSLSIDSMIRTFHDNEVCYKEKTNN
jgi:hypothetical protein